MFNYFEVGELFDYRREFFFVVQASRKSTIFGLGFFLMF